MSNQHDVDGDLPESQDSAQEQGNEEGGEEHGYVKADEDDFEYYKDDEKDSEHYRLYRLFRLLERDKEPRLDPQPAFRFVSIDRSTIPLQKEQFRSRLKKFLKDPDLRSRQGQDRSLLAENSELCDFLFERAVHAHMHIAAWNSMAKKAKNPEVGRSRRYLRQELGRYVKIRSLLTKQRQTLPSWMAEWKHCWVEAFEGIQEEIESQLRGAKKTLDFISQVRKSDHADESAILWIEKQEIHKYIKSTPFRRKLELIVAAFAYAAKLVHETKNGTEDGTAKYFHLIKQRVSRISVSKSKRGKAHIFLLQTGLAMIPSDPKGGDRAKRGA
jgi:hypothetical protein